MASFFLDTFTDAAGTLLSAHTSDSGVTWAKKGTGTAQITATGTLRPSAADSNATAPAFYQATATPPSADYSVTATASLKSPRNGDAISVAGRVDPTADSGYFAYYSQGSGLAIVKHLNGVGSFITPGGNFIPYGMGDGITFGLSMVGNTIRLFANGVILATVIDSSITAAGLVGVFLDSLSATSDTLGYHLDAVQATAFSTLPVTDANLLGGLSARNWDTGFAGKVLTTCAGASLKLALTGTGSASLALTAAGVAGNGVYAKVAVDGGAWSAPIQITAATTSLGLFAGRSATGTHTVLVQVLGVDYAADCWGSAGNAPANAFSLAGLLVDVGGATASLAGTALALKGVSVETQGDSISFGYATEGVGSLAGSDPTHAWSYLAAQGLQAEWTNIAYCGEGWAVTAYPGSNVPVYPNAWAQHNNAHARSYAGSKPDFLLVNMGTNPAGGGNFGGTGVVATSAATGTVRADMALKRATMGPLCRIIYLVPFGGFQRTNLLNDLSFYGGGTGAPGSGYTSVADGTTTIYKAAADPLTWLIDLGAGETTGLSGVAVGTAYQQSIDDIHPLRDEQARKAALILHAIQVGLGGAAGGGGFFF